MRGFNTSIIKPKKLEGAKKVPSSSFMSAMDMEELEPKEKFETSESAESYKVPSANKVSEKSFEGAKKPSSELSSSIDIMLDSSKKNKNEAIKYMKDDVPSANKVPDTEDPKEMRKKYLEMIKKQASKMMP